MENDKPNYYAVIPANVRYDENLKLGEKMMFGEITSLANKTGVCYASNNYFANLYKVTPQAISKWIKALEKNNYITISYEKEGKLTTRRIVKIVQSEVSTDIDTINSSLEGYQQEIKENNTSINNQKEIYKERFETFYKEYPKKVSKQKTLQWFMKHKPDEELFNKMMSSLKKQKQTQNWLKDNGQYIPYPTTWLNGERWEDEVDVESINEDRRVYF